MNHISLHAAWPGCRSCIPVLGRDACVEGRGARGDKTGSGRGFRGRGICAASEISVSEFLREPGTLPQARREQAARIRSAVGTTLIAVMAT